jgi:hypothetical protein
MTWALELATDADATTWAAAATLRVGVSRF